MHFYDYLLKNRAGAMLHDLPLTTTYLTVTFSLQSAGALSGLDICE